MRHASMTHVGLALCLVGCPAVKPIEEENGSGGIPTEIQRIFDESCANAGCHGMGTAQQSLNLEADQSPSILTTNAQQNPSLLLVDLGSVDGSYLAIKMIPEHMGRTGDIMPPPGYSIPEEDRALVLGWIAGAPLSGGGTGGETEGVETDDTTEGETGTEPMVQSCALEDVKPGAPNPIEAGTEAEQIPPDIADALERNCGCHYAEQPLANSLAPYPGMLDMATWAGFQEELAFPLCESDVAYVCVQERLDHALPMPPAQCVLEDGSRITDEDLALLDAWLDEGAPDGATWTP